MRERPHYTLTLRETARHFGLLRALLALVLKALKIRPVVLLARDASGPYGPAAEDEGVRPVTSEDAPLFEQAGFREQPQRKLADGPGWTRIDQGRWSPGASSG